MYARIASAPYRSTISSGPVTLPARFPIFVPPDVTQPLTKKRANGSRKPTRPRSFSAFMKKRA